MLISKQNLITNTVIQLVFERNDPQTHPHSKKYGTRHPLGKIRRNIPRQPPFSATRSHPRKWRLGKSSTRRHRLRNPRRPKNRHRSRPRAPGLACTSPPLHRQKGSPRLALLSPILGNYGGAFYLLIALSGIPQLHTYHQSRNIPEHITRLTCRDTYVWAQQYHDIGVFKNDRFSHPGDPGAWGLCTRILSWLLGYLNGDLYRIGRLQYKIGPFRQKMRAYRHRTSEHLCLLCESGLEFRTDGNFNGAGGREDPKAWTSELTETTTHITGNPIHPNGHAQRQPVSLSRSQWDCVLIEGDPILEIHIPEDGPMGFDLCGDSLRQVAKFFPNTSPIAPSKRSVAHPGCSTPHTSSCSPKIPTSPASSENVISFPSTHAANTAASIASSVHTPTTSPQPHATAA